jgi:putative membrane protein
MPVSLALALLLVTYAAGVIRFRRHAGAHRGPPTSRIWAMTAGLCVIELALNSPLDDLAERLLSAHMTQHLLLMLFAAPLLVWGRPTAYLVWSLPMPLRKGLGYLWNRGGVSSIVHLMKAPAIGWVGFCGTVILWHIPELYRWAMGNEIRHVLMHLSFLGAALLFWSVVLAPARRRILGYAAAGVYVFSAALLTGLPGALIAFARHPLYVDEPAQAMPWGLSALADQQLAGLIMWIPMDLLLFAVALVLFGLALSRNSSIARGDSGVGTSRFVLDAKKAQRA